MNRALMGTMVSSGARPFSCKVLPVSTMSTITSDNPSSGAISMEPLSLMMLISRLRAL